MHHPYGHARDRGCTHPGCLQPGYHCEVHHARAWANGGRTNADNLFFACTAHHTMVSKHRRTTTVADNGRLAWTNGTRPPHVNRAHHPHEIIDEDDDDECQPR